mmetsp:Transcript_51372/g.104541  ORF Transcript_51372/g.104541 Transcript_51372/m.104541 type:complete len:176 (+) Transcript_51372:83-610(+)
MGKTTKFGQPVSAEDCECFGYPAGHVAAAANSVTTGEGISCGGVALQRIDCLKYGHVNSGDYFRKIGGLGMLQFMTSQKPCRPNDLYKHFEKQDYSLDWGDTKWLQSHLERGNSPAVVLIGHQEHYVVAIGIKDGEVYWIDYNGIFRAPLEKFRSNASSIQPFAGNFWNCMRVFL